jgi:enoyl-CoA hydratase/carnithine racemase
MDYKNILVDNSECIGTITINRPEVRNALDELTMKEIVNAVDRINSDDYTRVIVIKGAGDKAFCSGGDLNSMIEAMGKSSIEIQKFTEQYGTMIDVIMHSKKPTISAVHGFAMAGGCGLAVTCDITIASDNAVFALPEINLGIWGAMISAPIVRMIGLKKAMEILFTGRRINASEAEKIGMVNRVVPQANLEKEARELAKDIASKSPLAISMGKDAF